MDGEVRIAPQHLLVAIAWPFAAMNIAKVFHLVDHRSQYFAPSSGIAVSMALAASPVIVLGVYERLRRKGLAAEISMVWSAATLCGVYLAAWLVSRIVIGPYSFS
jgi:hypothetical protein